VVTTRLAWVLAACAAAAEAQGGAWSYRGFIENRGLYYPSATASDRVHFVNETLLRAESSVRLGAGFRLAGGLDLQTDSDNQSARAWHFSWDDRLAQRPPFALRTLSLQFTRGPFRLEAGKQVLRWGLMDLASPTDKLAPREYLNPSGSDYLGVFAARAVADSGPNSVELLYLPRFTPSRLPLAGRRWLILPPEFDQYAYRSQGTWYPGGGQFGARYHRIVSPYEFSLCYLEGFKNLPTLLYQKDEVNKTLDYRQLYPKMRMAGADFTAPWHGFLWKAEASYIRSVSPFLAGTFTYAVQAERLWDKWQLGVALTGDHLTEDKKANTIDIDRALRESVSGRAAWTPTSAQTLSGEWFLHPNGKAFVARILYARTFSSVFRVTTGCVWIAGSQSDALARYDVNSYVTLQFRYSF
jgi:hypothetical protein